MRSVLSRLSPTSPLRVGLGFVFLYSGADLIREPGAWVWAVPGWFADIVEKLLPLEGFLRIQGGVELAMSAVFLLWFLPPKIVLYAALLASAEFLGILLLTPTGINDITFRDIGLLGAALALTLILWERTPPLGSRSEHG